MLCKCFMGATSGGSPDTGVGHIADGWVRTGQQKGVSYEDAGGPGISHDAVLDRARYLEDAVPCALMDSICMNPRLTYHMQPSCGNM